MNRDPWLVECLDLAVPLWMAELYALDERDRVLRMQLWRREAGPVIAERGDVLMFRGKKKSDAGKTGMVFNHLARGLAALAFCPGGVRFADRHWCAADPTPDDPIPAPSTRRAVQTVETGGLL